MTPPQAREIVRAAIDWVHAHDLRMAASRAKRQTGPFDRDSYRASGAVTEAKRLERMALKALHRAVMPKVITTRAREVLEVVALEVQAHPQQHEAGGRLGLKSRPCQETPCSPTQRKNPTL